MNFGPQHTTGNTVADCNEDLNPVIELWHEPDCECDECRDKRLCQRLAEMDAREDELERMKK